MGHSFFSPLDLGLLSEESDGERGGEEGVYQPSGSNPAGLSFLTKGGEVMVDGNRSLLI